MTEIKSENPSSAAFKIKQLKADIALLKVDIESKRLDKKQFLLRLQWINQKFDDLMCTESAVSFQKVIDCITFFCSMTHDVFEANDLENLTYICPILNEVGASLNKKLLKILNQINSTLVLAQPVPNQLVLPAKILSITDEQKMVYKPENESKNTKSEFCDPLTDTSLIKEKQTAVNKKKKNNRKKKNSIQNKMQSIEKQDQNLELAISIVSEFTSKISTTSDKAKLFTLIKTESDEFNISKQKKDKKYSKKYKTKKISNRWDKIKQAKNLEEMDTSLKDLNERTELEIAQSIKESEEKAAKEMQAKKLVEEQAIKEAQEKKLVKEEKTNKNVKKNKSQKIYVSAEQYMQKNRRNILSEIDNVLSDSQQNNLISKINGIFEFYSQNFDRPEKFSDKEKTFCRISPYALAAQIAMAQKNKMSENIEPPKNLTASDSRFFQKIADFDLSTSVRPSFSSSRIQNLEENLESFSPMKQIEI